MTNNIPANVHYDQYLTSFAVDYYNSQNFIADRVFSNTSVEKQSDKYYVFGAENTENENLVKEAVPMVQPNMFEVNQSEDTYFARVYDAGFMMDTFTEANEDRFLRTRERKLRGLMEQMLKKRDRDFINTYLKTGVWGEDLAGTTDFTKWSDSASTPIDDVMKWKEDFWVRNNGLGVNKLVISKDIKRHLLTNTQLLGRINGGATVTNPAMVNDSILAAVFEVEEIVWADAVSVAAGATVPAYMVSDRMLMVHTEDGGGMESATAGKIFSWDSLPDASFGITVTTLDTPEQRFVNVAEKVKAEMCYDFKVTGASLGTYVEDLV